MAEIQGSYDELFTAVPNALAGVLDSGETGASVAVFVDGRPVVDVWGGHADAGRTVPWQHDTITNVFSVSKLMGVLCALILADRGEIGLDLPVARYWPEFAAAGKENVLVRHVLGHTAGLPDFDPPFAVEDLYDWRGATARLAAQAPRWEPGTAAGYHSITQGFLIGEVVRRVTGSTLGEYFAAEVAGPLGADFHIDLSPEDDARLSPTLPPPGESEDFVAAAPGPKAEPVPAGHEGLTIRHSNSPAWRRSQIPAVGGYGNARSVALVQSVMACGGTVRGVRLLSPEGCARGWEEQFRGEDSILGMSIRYGMGYGVFGNTYGWGGWGGSMLMLEPQSRMAVAYVTNQVPAPELASSGGHGLEMVMAAYDGLKALNKDS
jgi:CubicO group peptidase (beta-lactamase class C family)